MKLKLYLYTKGAASVREDTVVVIDALRATSFITLSMAKGASAVYPVKTVEQAFAKAMVLSDSIIAGEVNTVKPDGFKYGNSPTEIMNEDLNGKNIILRTSAGTQVLNLLKSSEILICSFLNARAIADAIGGRGRDEEVGIVCSGYNGEEFAIEDFLCAGAIIGELTRIREEIVMEDMCRLAMHSWICLNGKIARVLRKSIGGKRLISLGYEDDIEFCSQVKVYDVVPRLRGEVIDIS